MNVPGKGWVRRVTVATLYDFRSLLRTGSERAAETQGDEEVNDDGALENGPAASAADVADPGTTDASPQFSGTPIEVPSQYRSHPQSASVPSAGSPASSSTTTDGSTPSPTSPPVAPQAVAVRRWFKRMSAADAQRPTGQNTNPTGHLTLVRSGHPIQQATWFRNDLFAGENWTPVPSPMGQRERATIIFHIWIAGADIGEIALDVTYTPSFEASQGNRTTVVHWGTTIGDRFRQHDYTNYHVTIERTASGTFLMVIDSNPTGAFAG